ncbi:MAG: LytR family transcriptional regulator [Solirubrobacterales bacterium]|jgi:LCP family protein required for cell wall assembly|nr:LytR family transcriptional regulator [Solirubrobacterales bacterium]
MSPPPRGHWWMWKRFLIAVFLIVGLAAGATATAGLLQVKQIADAIKAGHNSLALGRGVVDQAPPGEAQTILILGSDKRLHNFGGNKNVRSDTILLARLNPKGGASTLMSIPRDLEVTIPGHGQDKINAAYAEGGPSLSAKVIKALLSTPTHRFKINHIINVNFSGFQRAVNYLGRVYTDVDRYYFNDNAPPAGGGGAYASIDIKPGYQLLAGGASLDYVRFRHLDTDLTRARRQQTFLRDAADQYGAGKLIRDRTQLARIFGRYTQYDHSLTTVNGLNKLLDLVIFLGSKPIVEVPFPGQLPLDPTDPFVHVASQSLLTKRVNQFLNGDARTPKPPKPAKTSKRPQKRTKASAVPGMVDASTLGESQGAALAAGVGLPVYYPKLIPIDARYPSMIANVYPRAYSIDGPLHHKYKSYRLTLEINGGVDGRYVGVEGTTWKTPPILDRPSETRSMNHRKLELFFDSNRLRLVAWRTANGVYWIENDLRESVSNRQMLAMASSLTRIGSKR